MVSIGAKDWLALGRETVELVQDIVYHTIFKHPHQHTVLESYLEPMRERGPFREGREARERVD